MYLKFTCIIVFVLLQQCEAVRVLGLFPHTGKSHQMVFDPLLRALAQRGHNVTVATHFPQQNLPENYTEVSLAGISEIGVEVFNLEIAEQSNTVLKFLGLERPLMETLQFKFLADKALEICDKLLDWPALKDALKKEYDVVIMENFNSDCMLGLLHVYGVKAPLIGVSSCTILPWHHHRIGLSDNPSYVPLITSARTDKMNFWERLENTITTTFLKYFYYYYTQRQEQEMIEKFFDRKIPDLHLLSKNFSLILANTHHSLNGRRPLVPGYIEVGGMYLDHSRKTIPPHIERFINESEHGVIIFSFGSLIKTASMRKEKEQMFVNALSNLKQRVIWKFEDSSEYGNLTGNILRVKWMPQYELLQHKKVVAFIAHGGLLGMTEAVSAGKPMLVIPFFGDQSQNGAAAVEAGVATMVKYRDLTEKSLTRALEQVLRAETRLKARRLSKIWKDRETDPLEKAIFWTERVARWGHEAPLHTAARDLTFIEYALIDVVAALIAALLVVILIIKFIVKSFLAMLVSFVIGSKKEKVKKH